MRQRSRRTCPRLVIAGCAPAYVLTGTSIHRLGHAGIYPQPLLWSLSTAMTRGVQRAGRCGQPASPDLPIRASRGKRGPAVSRATRRCSRTALSLFRRSHAACVLGLVGRHKPDPVGQVVAQHLILAIRRPHGASKSSGSQCLQRLLGGTGGGRSAPKTAHTEWSQQILHRQGAGRCTGNHRPFARAGDCCQGQADACSGDHCDLPGWQGLRVDHRLR